MKLKQADSINSIHTTKIFVICNQPDTAPVWGYILQQQGLVVILETSIEKAVEHWSKVIPDLTVIDVDVVQQDPVEICKNFKAVSVAPILLFLPTYNETQVLAAYSAGADNVIIKPISPAVFLAKIKVWLKRSWTIPVEGLSQVKAGGYRLDASKRCLMKPEEPEIKLTNLEFRLLHLLMSQPEEIFSIEDLIRAIWGAYNSGDHILLKNVVYRLRKKIEVDPANPVCLKTWPGGYSFLG